jgi:hypothetical protein
VLVDVLLRLTDVFECVNFWFFGIFWKLFHVIGIEALFASGRAAVLVDEDVMSLSHGPVVAELVVAVVPEVFSVESCAARFYLSPSVCPVALL